MDQQIDSECNFQIALISKREISGLSLGRHWAVCLLNEKGNIVLHIRNWELGDSLDISAARSTKQTQLRITSWTSAQFVAYRGILFQNAATIDLDTLRELTWNVYNKIMRSMQNCQDFSVQLLQALGVKMDGWMLRADCFDAHGNIINIPIKEKKSVYNPVKLLTLGVLNKLSSAHWDTGTVYFNRVIRDLSRSWDVSVSSDAAGSPCCICLDQPREYACVPCGHLCLCENCIGKVLDASWRQCPICRMNVSSCMRIYHG